MMAYGTDLSPEDFEKLADNPKFIAIEESSADTRRISEIRRRLGDRFTVFYGVDDLVYECFSLGASMFGKWWHRHWLVARRCEHRYATGG